MEEVLEGKILIVDDDPMTRALYSRSLARRGHSVVCADSGFNALALLQRQRFDLVLLDIKMPKLSGVHVLEVSASFPSKPSFVILSATESEEQMARCYELGAREVLLKPIAGPALWQAVERELRSRRE